MDLAEQEDRAARLALVVGLLLLGTAACCVLRCAWSAARLLV